MTNHGHRERTAASQAHGTPMSPSSTSPTAALPHAVQVPTHGRTCIISQHAGVVHPLVASTSHNGHPGPISHGSSGGGTGGGASRLPVSIVYKRLIHRFQRPMKVADERASILALRPVNHEWGVVDNIESRIEQQWRAVSSIKGCIAECNRMHKPRMQEAVVVRQTAPIKHCPVTHSHHVPLSGNAMYSGFACFFW